MRERRRVKRGGGQDERQEARNERQETGDKRQGAVVMKGRQETRDVSELRRENMDRTS
jgi:hypothetical protein